MQIKSSFNALGLIVYVSAARIVIYYIGSFKSAFLELFIKNLKLDFQKPVRLGSQAKDLSNFVLLQEQILIELIQTHILL